MTGKMGENTVSKSRLFEHLSREAKMTSAKKIGEIRVTRKRSRPMKKWM